MIKKPRPIHLDFKNIKFPLTAIASISHRISGVIIFVIVGVLLIILKLSLLSKEHFYQIKVITNHLFIKFIIWSALVLFIYHVLNGVRNILMDIGYLNKTLSIGKRSASITFLLTGILSIVIGFLLCYTT